MRELRLKYFIELASNIGAKARTEAQALQQSQDAIKSAVDKTTGSFVRLDTAYLRFLNNTGTERQIGYMQLLARSIDYAQARMERLRSTALKFGKAGAAGFAGFQAAKAVLPEPTKIERTYERALADAANIAFPYGSRKQGMVAMNASVEGAVKSGGGTRDSALKAMNDLYAANIDKDVVTAVLPHMQKYATAGNADPANIAQLVIYGLRSLKLDPKDIPLMLDKTLASTKMGSMEFDSLAKWMPQVGAAGGMAGLRGMKGYEAMLAGVQTSRLTSGTKDEAGTNFKDLLSMINGHALMTAAKKLGISPSDAIAKHIAEGGDAITGIVGLADRVADSDPRYMVLDKKLKAGGIARDKNGQPLYTPAQEEIMQQQAALFQGSALGKLFHNQQSMQALVALRNNRDYYKDQITGTGLAKGQIGGQDFETIAQTNDYKMQQKSNSELFAQTSSTGGINAVLGKFAEGTTALYEKYPEFAKYIEGAKLAIFGLGAAAGSAAAALALLGLFGGKNVGGLPGLGGPGGGLPGAGKSPGAFPTLEGAKPTATRGAGGAGSAGGGVGGVLRKLGWIGAGVSLASELFMTSDADMATLNAADARKANEANGGLRGKGYNDPRLLSLTTPSIADQAMAMGQTTKIELGQGELAVKVTVNDERASAATSLTTPMSSVKVSAGATKPEGTW